VDQEKRERIIEVAQKTFARFGFKKTSIDDVARGAGVAKGTVYLAVKSKGELYYEVLLRELRDWEAEIVRTIDPSMPADQQLVFASRLGLESLQRRPLLQELFDLEAVNAVPDLRDRLEALREGGVELTTSILRKGIDAGLFRGDIDVEAVAMVLLDLQMATVLFHVRDRPLDDPSLHAQLERRGMTVFDMIVNGLRPRP
jgi:AcrR family transcriptional regulator